MVVVVVVDPATAHQLVDLVVDQVVVVQEGGSGPIHTLEPFHHPQGNDGDMMVNGSETMVAGGGGAGGAGTRNQ